MLTRMIPVPATTCQHPDNLHERYPNFNLVPGLQLRYMQAGLIVNYLIGMRRTHYADRESIDKEIASVTSMRAAYGLHG